MTAFGTEATCLPGHVLHVKQNSSPGLVVVSCSNIRTVVLPLSMLPEMSISGHFLNISSQIRLFCVPGGSDWQNMTETVLETRHDTDSATPPVIKRNC